MNYSFEITRDDLVKAGHDIASYTRAKCYTFRHKLIYSLIGVTFWIPVGYAWAYTKNTYGTKASIAVLVTVISLLAYRYVSSIFVRHMGKQIPKEGGPSIGNYKVALDSDGITFENNNISTKAAWNSIIDISVTQSLILLFIDRNSALIIPKMDIDHERLLSEISAYVPCR